MSTSPAFSEPEPHRAAPGQLPLELSWDVSPGVPAVPAIPRHLRIVGAPEDASQSYGELPDPGRWAARLAAAIADVMVGVRPPAQLTRWLTREQLLRVTARAHAIARHPAMRAQRDGARGRTVRSVRICPVAAGVVEASAVLVGGSRAQAIAMRLEAVQGRWLATVVKVA